MTGGKGRDFRPSQCWKQIDAPGYLSRLICIFISFACFIYFYVYYFMYFAAFCQHEMNNVNW